MRPTTIGAAIVAFATIGCAGQTQTTTAPTTQPASAPGSGSARGVFTHEQLAQTNANNVYDALSKLRPSCIRARAVVYRDGLESGTAAALQQVNVSEVGSVECLSALDASQRFGLNFSNAGAIVLTSRRR